MRKIYFNGYLITLRENDWFQDRDGKWHHLVIQEQTQEPENEPECNCITPPSVLCPVHGTKFKEKPAKKECEHKWYTSTKQGAEYCHHCGLHREEKKDELAERLDDVDKNHPDYWTALAEEARKWSVEQVEKWNETFWN